MEEVSPEAKLEIAWTVRLERKEDVWTGPALVALQDVVRTDEDAVARLLIKVARAVCDEPAVQAMREALCLPFEVVGSAVQLAAVQRVAEEWKEVFLENSKVWWTPSSLSSVPLVSVAAGRCPLEMFRWIAERVTLEEDDLLGGHMVTPLHEAVTKGSLDVVRYLMEQKKDWFCILKECECNCPAKLKGGIDYEVCDARENVLAIALEDHGRSEKALYLVQKASYLGPYSVIAALDGHMPFEVIRAIVTSRVFASLEDGASVSCWSKAIEHSRVDVLQLFLDKWKVPVNVVSIAAQMDSVEAIKWFLENGHLPSGFACFEAAKRGHVEALDVLLQAAVKDGIPECVLYVDKYHRGLLHAACQAETVREVIAILKKSVIALGLTMDELNTPDKFGKAPMTNASGEALEELQNLFPADTAWKALEISVHDLIATGEVIGKSQVTVEAFAYGTPSCIAAVKRYPEHRRSDMRREFGITTLLRHPCLPRILGWVQLDFESLGIVTEEYGDNLLNVFLAERIDPRTKEKWACEIAAGLRYLHKRNITHGDVDASNVLVSPHTKRAVLCDFNFSCIEGAHPHYLSGFSVFPQFSDEIKEVSGLQRADWVQFGFLLVAMACNGKWNWRQAAKKIEERVEGKFDVEEFLKFVDLRQEDYVAVEAFLAPAFETVEPKRGDDEVKNASNKLNALFAQGGTVTPVCSDDDSRESQEELPESTHT